MNNSPIAVQVKAHLEYGQISFKESKISETSQFSHWFFDEKDREFAVFIDGSKLLIDDM